MKLMNRKVLNATVGSTTALATVIVACLMSLGDGALQIQPRVLSEEPLNPSRSVLEVRAPSEKSGDFRAVSKADHEELLRKIERLESLVADSTRRDVTPEVGDPNARPEENEALSPEAEEERALAQLRAQVETLGTALHAEFVDGDWAKPAMIALSEAFEAETAEGIEMLEVDCRGSMCRVALAFDPALAEESFRKIQASVPWEGEVFFHIEDVDSGEAVVYIAREDQRLPRAAE